MKSTIKALALVLLGLIIWSGLVYIALAFIEVEANPFIWHKSIRIVMLGIIFCYMAFTPLLVISLMDEIKKQP